jgi:putative oxidoreductase
MSQTNKNKFLIVPRLLAGLPLVGLGVMHFVNPVHMRNILIASGLPMVELSVFAAPAGEVLAGVLLLLGFYARIGGLIGAGTMLPAIYSTVILSKMTVETLPGGLTEVPFVPPLPLPAVVLICSLAVAALGSGAWSLGPHKQEGL